MLILGIESSCDETGVALYRGDGGDGELLAHALHSQVAMHQDYGGVVPELASRDHVRRLIPLLRKVLADGRCALAEVDAVAYTQGPGLAGALLWSARLSPRRWRPRSACRPFRYTTSKATCSRRCSPAGRRAFPSSPCSCRAATAS